MSFSNPSVNCRNRSHRACSFNCGRCCGWGSTGRKNFAIERLAWTGKVPFEIHEMRAKPDGFEVTFTKPIDPNTAGQIKSYAIKTFTYIYQASYGSPVVDETTPTITKVTVGQDKKSVRLYV